MCEMRRNRSPVRYLREKSREKSFSISSLSDCSLGKGKKSPQWTLDSKDNEARNLKDRTYRDGQYSKNAVSYASYDYSRNKKRSRSREKEGRTSKHGKHNSHGQIKHNSQGQIKGKSYSSASSSHRSENKRKTSEPSQQKKPGDRLQRLEEMVELLVTNKSSKGSEASDTKTVNYNEFIPGDNTFTTTMWLNKINNECLERNFSEKECLQYTQSKMTGLLKAWFKTLDLFDYTWPEIKMLIINTFPDNVDFAATLRLLVNRSKKADETITQYYFSKMYLLEACKITGANAVSVLIDGLNDPYWQQDARSRKFLNPEVFYAEFLAKLPNFGLQQPPSDKYQQRQVVEQYEVPSAHYEVSTTHYEVPTAHYDYENRSYHPTSYEQYVLPDRRLEPMEDLRNNIGHARLEKQAQKEKVLKKCYKCGEHGHIAIKCMGNLSCYKCNQTGHVAARCPHADLKRMY